MSQSLPSYLIRAPELVDVIGDEPWEDEPLPDEDVPLPSDLSGDAAQGAQGKPEEETDKWGDLDLDSLK